MMAFVLGKAGWTNNAFTHNGMKSNKENVLNVNSKAYLLSMYYEENIPQNMHTHKKNPSSGLICLNINGLSVNPLQWLSFFQNWLFKYIITSINSLWSLW